MISKLSIMEAGLACLLFSMGFLTEVPAFYSCPSPVLPTGTKVALTESTVILTCGEEERFVNSTIEWRFNGNKKILKDKRSTENKNVLVLQSITLKETGIYSCYIDGELIDTHNVSVREALQKPSVSCYRRSPINKIRCEWKLSKKWPYSIRASLVVKKGFSGLPSEYKCRYYELSNKFSCIVNHTEEDDILYFVKMCVTDGYTTESSKEDMLSSQRIIKPDPPENVTVNPVQNAPQKLNVTWVYPRSWWTTFYRLRFQIRYRADRVQDFTTMPEVLKTSCMIDDAWMKFKHIVQVRGMEEFRYGTWSEWSEEVSNTPWTEPEPEPSTPQYQPFETPVTTEDLEVYNTDGVTCRTVDCNENSGRTSDVQSSVTEINLRVPQYTFWIVGIIQTATIVLFIFLISRCSWIFYIHQVKQMGPRFNISSKGQHTQECSTPFMLHCSVSN
ncbi:interleukin-6 receptor subunit alpha isoform X2 [Protopterus annectens]|uniref:interleukin-6 receptor subunit alpha isoform X2 n=1 Tax=Protopterus annectens TaxID=7888 RepID=UPI001CFA2EE7|nr:interleukin-6 receptor subunit alpha isoform X2 [Protopterus annectens]